MEFAFHMYINIFGRTHRCKHRSDANDEFERKNNWSVPNWCKNVENCGKKNKENDGARSCGFSGRKCNSAWATTHNDYWFHYDSAQINNFFFFLSLPFHSICWCITFHLPSWVFTLIFAHRNGTFSICTMLLNLCGTITKHMFVLISKKKKYFTSANIISHVIRVEEALDLK